MRALLSGSAGARVSGWPLLLLGGVVMEAGWLWILLLSPRLTAIYTPAFTREFVSRLRWLGLSAVNEPLDAWTMVGLLEVGLLATIAGYSVAMFGLASQTRRAGALLERSAARGAQVVLGFALLFRLTLLLLPGLFSTDLFSYVMYGRIAAVHGGNPYVQVPADYPGDPFLSWVFPFWRDAPAVYGPLWTDFSWLLTGLTANWSNFDQVLAYRLVLAVMDLLTLPLMWWLLARTCRGEISGGARLLAFAVFAWNPLLLFDLPGNSHNDVAMVLLMLLGVFATVKCQAVPSVLAMTMSALVKYTTGIAVLFWIVAIAARAPVVRNSVVRLALTGALVLALTFGVALPWLQAPAALGPLQEAAGGRLVLNSAPDVVALTIADQVVSPLGVARDAAEASVRFWTRAVSRALFLVYLLYELSNLWRRSRQAPLDAVLPMSGAAARALLVLPLVVLTWVWSWYFSWSLALAVLLGWTSWLLRLVVLYTLFALPIVYAHQYLGEHLSGAFVLLMAMGPLLAWLAWLMVGGSEVAGARLLSPGARALRPGDRHQER